MLTNFLLDANPTIVAISETWLNSQYTDGMVVGYLPYSLVRVDRNRVGGGVAILLRDHICYTLVHTLNKKCSGVIIDAHFCSDVIRIIVIYRPPNTLVSECDELYGFIELGLSTDKHTILVGDFNLPTTHHRYQHYENLFRMHDLGQHIREATCGENTLDYLLTNHDLVVVNVELIPPFGSSDHSGFRFSFTATTEKRNLAVPFPDFKSADFILMKQRFSTLNWELILSGFDSIDELYAKFCQSVIEVMSVTVPVKIKAPQFRSYPAHINRLKTKRDELYQRLKGDITLLWEFKQISKRLLKSVQKFEKRKEEKFLENLTNKKLFSFIKNKFAKRSGDNSLVLLGQDPVISSQDRCELLAKHFASVFVENYDTVPNFEHITPAILGNFLIFPHHVLQASKNLKSSCSITSDGIPQIVFKKCIFELSTPLAHIFNFSLALGKVPILWKKAVVTAIPKIKNANLPKDFRPISLLPTPSKIMEKIIKYQLDNHIARFDILPQTQYGFRSGSNINDLMIKCVHDWSRALSSHFMIDVVYADISKAFDKVNHRKLLAQLRRIGIGGNLLLWFESYFCERQFCVKIDGSISRFYSAPSGVPQGAVLSPILFNIYVCDILRWNPLPRDVKVFQFADDIKIYTVFDINDCFTKSEHLQQAMNHISDYLFSLNLDFNPQKSHVLHMGPGNPKMLYHVNYYFVQGIDKGSVRDLGVIIDPKMTFRAHIESIVERSRKVSFQILKLFKTTNEKLLIRLFNCYVRPILEFGSPIWSPHHESQKLKIEKILKTYTRIVWHKSHPNERQRPNYSDRLQLYNQHSLTDRRLLLDALYLRKVMNNLSNCRFSDIFILQATRGRVLSFKIFRPNFGAMAYTQSFPSRVIPLLEDAEFRNILSSSHNAFQNAFLENITHFKLITS